MLGILQAGCRRAAQVVTVAACCPFKPQRAASCPAVLSNSCGFQTLQFFLSKFVDWLYFEAGREN